MSLLHWLQALEARLLALGLRVATDERADLYADVERTVEQLQRRHAATKACQESLRQACGWFLDDEQRVGELEDAVRASTAAGDPAAALRSAVELEGARAALACSRVRVERLRQAYENHHDEMTRLEYLLAGLQARLSPC